MTQFSATDLAFTASAAWLKKYYFTRAAFSLLWFLIALTVGHQSTPVAAALLIAYPAWDAFANSWDASRNGGLSRNPSQAFNLAVSVLVTIAVAIALTTSMNWVLGVFGVWAIFSGLLQLATGVRRWKITSGQWSMILSGAQSSLAGGFFISQALTPKSPSIADVAGYAAFGAFYFLVSAISLAVRTRRQPVTPNAVTPLESAPRFETMSKR